MTERRPASLIWITLVLSLATVKCGERACQPADTCQTGVVTPPAPPPAPPLAEPRLTVSNTGDVLNGDTGDPARLVARPGNDGISLREAIIAVNNSTTPIEITFDVALLGKSIVLESPLPFLRRAGTVVLGLNGSDGQPGITISGGRISEVGGYALVTIAASNTRIARLRITDVGVGNIGIRIIAGAASASFEGGGPQEVTNVRIEESRFDNSPRTTDAYAVRIGASQGASDTRIRSVTLAGNSFHHFKGGATTVIVAGEGQRGAIEGVDLHDNTFTECMFCVELVNVQFADNSIRDIRVVRNSFTSSSFPMAMGNEGRPGTSVSTRNVITRILISENTFTGNTRNVMLIAAGYGGATGNTISSVWLLNNVVANNGSGIRIVGGDSANANRVENVTIAHTTFYNTSSALALIPNFANSAGNTVSGVLVMNSIFWNNNGDISGPVTPQVLNTITRQAGIAGSNGNLNADPLFVASQAGDFRLLGNSPAIDRGSTQCPLATDHYCNARTGAPDLGAFEFGSSQNRCGSSLPSFPAPCSLAMLLSRTECASAFFSAAAS